jgi:protein SCO1/2
LLSSLAARGDGAGIAPAPPGTYTLQHILSAPEGRVVDVDGKARRFSRFTTGKVTLLSLIYTRCGDGRGCPLASHLMQQLKGDLDNDLGLAQRVRFVSLSFDPANDTPAAMREYAGRYVPAGDRGLPWHFLTTRSRADLRPLLEGFGQDVWKAAEDSGTDAGALPHVLKLFLLDSRGSVREIYSTSFLQQQALLGDIRTLLLEDGA